MFKITIGKAFVFKKDENNPNPPKTCPEGYDSVVLEDPDSIKKGIYSYKYYIYDSSKILLLYGV